MSDRKKQETQSTEVKGVLKPVSKIDYDGHKPKEDWPEEIGGVDGPEPTRYGDWEKDGRCTDF